MKIDWAALGIVAAISIVATVLFMLLLASGIRLVASGLSRADLGVGGGRARTAGFALLGCAGLLVLFGIYLILPISG